MADPPVKADPGSDTQGLDYANAMEHEHPSLSSGVIDQLICSSSVLQLEAGVQVGVRLLEDLKAALNAGAGNPQLPQWLQHIQQVEKKATPTRIVIGVIGVTGAGKSSVINAILDEERLVPTSGLRACTASATEISYNHSDDPNELYRAEVEFISTEEWSRELKSLLEDLIDGTGNISRECNNPDTEAGLAYSKIKAVYPHMSKEQTVRRASDPYAMAQGPLVRAVLGSVKRLRATCAQDLYNSLQQYIDSKEKTSSQMEYWPLIKVVRIYCKAAALSTGVILVDLPGVQDSNAARAAVAENYIKKCDGLWITADIHRAINNQAAQKLLGDSFKRQLKYDGAFSAVTFICTKADDILESEVEDSLQIKDEVGDFWEQIQVLGGRRNELNVWIEGLKKQKDDLDEQVEFLDASSDQWEELQQKLTDGEPVYRPSEMSKKRKRKNDLGRRRKTRGSVNEYSDSDDIDSDDAGDIETSLDSPCQKTPLTEDEVEDELASIKAQRKEARKAKKGLRQELSKAEKELVEVSADEAVMQSEMRSLCIRGRNKYLKDSIKRDFALGIKELDQELAIEANEVNFDPDEEMRDYDEVARGLPVFCVSARAFQKLAGRLEKDAVHIDGFTSLVDTEIPQLQEHAKALTERGRISTCHLFLNELNQLLNSMRLWTAGNARTAVSEKDQEIDEKVLRACFAKLDNILRQAIKACQASIKHEMEKQLYKPFDRLIPIAFGKAVETATGWGESRANGGLFWATYKATCRRDGKFSGSSGLKDFNAELFKPINRKLAANWERTFQRRIPLALAQFVGACKEALDAFHNDVATNVPGAAANPAGLNMLLQQKRTHQTMLEATPKDIGAKITVCQREANRGFTPVIQQAMQSAYDACSTDRGPGTFGRMKSTMESHVDTARNTMFRQACDAVKGQLDSMCAELEQQMTFSINDLLNKLQRDYVTTLGGRVEITAAVPLAEQMLHAQIGAILEDADSRFAQSCFPASDGMPAVPVGSEQDEDLIARQLEDVSESGTKPDIKPEPPL